MQGVITRGYCRGEQRDTSWRFAGYATGDAHENGVRPRAYEQACVSCSTLVLTLGGEAPTGVRDAFGLCRAVLDEWMRRHGIRGRVTAAAAPVLQDSAVLDAENVLGEMYAYLWHLYGGWDPRRLTFRSYATGILRKRVHRFVGVDLGLPIGGRTVPRAHSAATSQSYDAAVEAGHEFGQQEHAGPSVNEQLLSAPARWALREVAPREHAGYTTGEIALMLGVPIETVTKRRALLRRELKPQLQ